MLNDFLPYSCNSIIEIVYNLLMCKKQWKVTYMETTLQSKLQNLGAMTLNELIESRKYLRNMLAEKLDFYNDKAFSPYRDDSVSYTQILLDSIGDEIAVRVHQMS